MTISYDGNFAKLLLRWKGSIWKSVWKELLVFLALYYCIRIVYRYGLTVAQKPLFENAIMRFDDYTRYIPLTFLLGFYIAAIVKRWWTQFEWVAWPDDLLSLVCAIIPGDDKESGLKRHIIARYLNLTSALAWRDISVKVRKRFPTIRHFVKVGLMTEEEFELYNQVQAETIRWYLPLQWAQKIVQEVVSEGQIAAPLASNFYSQINYFRLCFRKLYCYDWVCIPLVYTQVAALATYGYFAFCLIGHQFLDMTGEAADRIKVENLYKVDIYIPVYTIIQFLFYIGWFKVGQDLMRPFGTDDDDIELNYILDRNIQASFSLADIAANQRPAIVPDKFWRQDTDEQLNNWSISVPHTTISAKIKEHPPKLFAQVNLKSSVDGEIVENTENYALLDSNSVERKMSKKHWRLF